jgi:hypothetical protein
MLDALVLEHTANELVASRACMVQQAHLYSLCMNAVWTTFGCCAAAAAPTGAGAPLLLLASVSPFVCWVVPFLSVAEVFSAGGPIEGAADGAVSMVSRGGERLAAEVLLEAEGRMGIDLCRL